MDDEITAAPAPGTTSGRIRSRPMALAESISEAHAPSDEASRTKFSFSPTQLQELIASRCYDDLGAFGGLSGLANGLRTDVKAGLGADEDILDGRNAFELALHPRPSTSAAVSFERAPAETHPQSIPGRFTDRRRVFGENRIPKRKPKTFAQLLWLAYNDKLMFLLTASATVSLALGIYQTAIHADSGPSIEWVEGVAIIVAVIVIVLATAANDYQKNYKFQKLNEKKDERMVTVVRSGEHRSVSIHDIVVGEVVHLEAGDVAPADGLLVSGFDVQCDESSLTGESGLVVKTRCGLAGAQDQPGYDPFILCGTQIATGVGAYLVLAVGANSAHAKVILSLQDEVEETPLQQKLGVLARYIVNVGFISGAIFFAVLFIKYLVNLESISGGPKEKGQVFLDIFILSITVIVIAVPEGLPLTVTLALAFATTKMLKDNNLVRLLRSCEVMGGATTVCSDKTGTLTMNVMTVVSGTLGSSHKFSDHRSALQGASDEPPLPTSTAWAASLSDGVRQLLNANIALNSTVIETDHHEQFVGSSTETALVKFASGPLAMGSLRQARANGAVVQMVPFDANRKCMAAVLRLSSGRYRMLVKGAAEVVLQMCTRTICNPHLGLYDESLSPAKVSDLNNDILEYSRQSLRVVSLAYRDFQDWPPTTPSAYDEESAILVNLSDLVLVGVFGIRDPLRPEVADSVRQCQAAGVFVRMVTGDSLVTAKTIASECGIYTAGGIAMDGPTFHRLTPAQLDSVIPRLQVLARSSPDDKLRLVKRLKSLDEVVAVTGDGTNDALALKAADVGFSMGLSGTEVAKEASDIVLIDDNFASIVKAVAWGRAVTDAAKKFLQFQFTINATAGILTVISAFVGGTESSVFAVVQLLWINLIMDTFAALALGTDYPTAHLLSRRPEPRTAPIMTPAMWKMVIGQSTYQLAVTFTLHYAGPSLFHLERAEVGPVQTLTFNTYVLMQFFNQINCRRCDNRFNILEGILRNPWFFLVQAVTLVGQILIIFVGGAAFRTVRLTGTQWGWSLLFGAMTIPIGMLIRLLPDRFVFAVPFTMDRHLSTQWLRRHDGFPRKKAQSPTRSRFRRLPFVAKILGREGGDSTRDMGPEPILLSNYSRDGTPTPWKSLPSSTAQIDTEFDLEGAIMASRTGSESAPPGLEIHPETQEDDPVLVDLGGRSGPPSQHALVIRHMGTG